MTNIGNSAFYGCSGLTKVNIEDLSAWCNISFDGFDSNPLSYAHHLYLNGEEIKDLVIPNSVTSIKNWFSGCSGLSSVTIPSGVTSIGSGAFSGCSGLTSITIPNSVTEIGEVAFYNCSGLTSITISNSVANIERATFSGCSGLTSVSIPNSVTIIADEAFKCCSNLASITIPESVTVIGENAFFDCSRLKEVHISDLALWCNMHFGSRWDGYEWFGSSPQSSPLYWARHLFLNGEEIKDLVIPESVSSISDYAFQNCTGLTSVILPSTLTGIGKCAFEGCLNITSVSIPKTIKEISDDAFYGCIKLATITSYVENPFEIGYNTFEGTWEKTTLYVPVGCKQNYEDTKYWARFMNIVEMDVKPVDGSGEIEFNDEIGDDTYLAGNLVGNIYYSISSGGGSYNAAEGCITVVKPTEDSTIDGKDIFGEDFKDNYTGIVFKVPTGSGKVKVNAETKGAMTLKVKVGNNEPTEMELVGKLKMSFPYSVSEDTYVYIYGGSKAAGAKGMNRAPSDGDMLKIYGIEVVSDADGISSIENGKLETENSPAYNLNGQRVSEPAKGIYIRNGRKVLVK